VAAADQPRKEHPNERVVLELAGFNVAAADQPRKGRYSWLATLFPKPASMWPRLISRGRLVDGSEGAAGDGCFNVAAADQPRKGLRLMNTPTAFDAASMWPRLISRGRIKPLGGVPGKRKALQCGRG